MSLRKSKNFSNAIIMNHDCVVNTQKKNNGSEIVACTSERKSALYAKIKIHLVAKKGQTTNGHTYLAWIKVNDRKRWRKNTNQ